MSNLGKTTAKRLLLLSAIWQFGMQASIAEDIHPWANFDPGTGEVIVAQAAAATQILKPLARWQQVRPAVILLQTQSEPRSHRKRP